MVFAVCALPILLSTAGFVFNEAFLYWFPNFAFAYGVLGLLFAVNLAGPALARRVQLALVLVSLAGLVFLSLAGLAGLGGPRAELGQQDASLGVRAVMLGLLLFVGLDLAVFAGVDAGARRSLAGPMASAVAAAAIVFCLWGYVSIMYVPLQELSETTIPYTVAAREVLGGAGRKIIGAVVISGVAAAVNAILLSVSSMMSAMAAGDYLPRFFGSYRGRAVIPLIVLAAGGAGMMAAGMAGEPQLLIYARGAMLLWLLNYAVLHLSVLRIEGIHELRLPGYPLVTVLGFLATGAAVVYLAWTDGERLELLKFMLNVFVVIYVAGLLWSALKRRGADAPHAS